MTEDLHNELNGKDGIPSSKIVAPSIKSFYTLK
jgi:hypothetical protein